MTGLGLFVLFVWLAFELNYSDMTAPPPIDPFRRDRWLAGEPDIEV